MAKQWIPEIEYEETESGLTSKIPFISVPKEEEMPRILFIFESRDTGEIEPGMDGEEVPVVELNLHQYVNMSSLKERLTAEEYDKVRTVLGLDPLKKAVEAGKKITDNVRKNVEKAEKTDKSN